MADLEIIDNEVVTTTTQSLEEFISQKKQELEMLDMSIQNSIDRKNTILSELESLIQ